ncbi:KDEL motif-containing protein [Ooceraea biroi]|uniref:KDEL motif-containing protein n=1 Tax=Ooceraea biroi TaxID=2015173 RepID=A0A026VYL1_OOCBI|nr:KDEL motif-containing protein [Ooceraea biroi]
MRLTTFLVVLICAGASNIDVDPLKTIVWGPGLKPAEITMRARYIFLQLVDSSGKNLTVSPGKNVVTGQVHGQSFDGTICRIWTQIYDCKDGSFIIRYKVFNTCFKIMIKVKIKGKELPMPSEIKGPVYEEECYCPNPSVTTWLHHYQCQQNYTQMHHDLSSFLSVDFDRIRESIIKRYDQPSSVSICHYILKSNKIYRRCYGQHVGFKIFMDAILLSLARKVVLPDIEFFVNLGDWPLVPNAGPLYPIFSWCGSESTKDIVMPTYDITESSLEAMGRVMLDTLSVQGNTELPWDSKIEQLFWRGRDSRRERLDLIDISRRHPDLFNVSITNFFFFRNEIDKYGPAQTHVSFFNFFKYKYQLNIDGTVAAYRFPYLLAGDSLVFKQESKYYEFFYEDLIPEVHYMPVKSDLSDLVDKITWAKEHDEDGLKIVKSARQFARDNLLPRDILCYHTVLFHV